MRGPKEGPTPRRRVRQSHSPYAKRRKLEKAGRQKGQEAMKLGKHISLADKYGPAMKMTDQAEADAYFAACVEHLMRFGLKEYTQAEAEEIERRNLGYYAGYYGAETRERVERLFRCSHPVFGAIAERGQPAHGDALWEGVRRGLGI